MSRVTAIVIVVLCVAFVAVLVVTAPWNAGLVWFFGSDVLFAAAIITGIWALGEAWS